MASNSRRASDRPATGPIRASPPGDRRELAAALARELAGEVRSDAYSRHLYAADASMYAVAPLAVAFPRDADDVAAAIAIAGRFDVPVVPRGAGTSLAGQAIGARGLVLDASRHMDAIGEIDVKARRAHVGPGVVQDDLNAAAAPHGLAFGPDTSTSNRATIGGMIGNNSSGSHSIVYGTTVDHVHELDVVLSDGSRARFGALDGAERAGTLEGAIHRGLPKIVRAHADAIASGYPRHWRQSGGYQLGRLLGRTVLPNTDIRGTPQDASPNHFELARFVVGTEGTLVVVTEATVGLVPRPKARQFAVGHFDSVAAAIAATDDALELGAAAIELIDRTILDLSRRKLEFRRLSEHLEGSPEALLFVTFFGDTEAEVGDRLDRLEVAWRRHGHGYHVARARTPAEQDALTKVRKSGLGLLMAASEGASRPLAFVEDTAVAPERLGDYVARFKAILDGHGLTAGFYGHCSVGCLHIRPYVDLAADRGIETMRAVAEEIVDLVAEFDGVNSSEHGDGRARSEFNRLIFGDELYEAMREVKRLFDPRGRLNPGVIVDAPPMTERLRDPALPEPGPLATRLSFAEHGGMRGAADRCMRIGACRKTGAGVMCPSYMATREEEHSTRGRANALVKALSEPDPRGALGDARLHEILDLCLECKACKSECPLSVDMASMKSEFLSHYQDIHGVPLRSRMFGAIRRLNRIGAATAPLSNLPARIGPFRAALERWGGIARERPLPRFERETLERWFRKRPRAGGQTGPGLTPRQQAAPGPAGTERAEVGPAGTERTETGPPGTERSEIDPAAPDRAGPAPRGDLVFLADSFTTFTEPAIGKAAIELLEAAGWRVRLESRGCCGRASISKGLLDQARAAAADMANRLAPEAQRGVPIVGCEPSCLLTLKEEHLALLPGDPKAQAVARQAHLVDELLVQAIDDGSLTLDSASPVANSRIVFHGHCHQKALAGTAATVELLRRIPGADVVELDAGCCGMAGSFGFEAEHYDLSMRIGESRLFPAVRGEDATTLIAATGVSCRQQIAHGTARAARHPVELVRDALAA